MEKNLPASEYFTRKEALEFIISSVLFYAFTAIAFLVLAVTNDVVTFIVALIPSWAISWIIQAHALRMRRRLGGRGRASGHPLFVGNKEYFHGAALALGLSGTSARRMRLALEGLFLGTGGIMVLALFGRAEGWF